MASLIRPGSEEDFEALADFWIATWQISAPEVDFAKHRPCFIADLTSALEDGRHILVAETKPSVPTGFVVVNPETAGLGHIAIAPEYLGRGVAADLMQAAKEICPQELFLTVNAANPRAIWFYAREGFEPLSETISPLTGQRALRMRWRRVRGN